MNYFGHACVATWSSEEPTFVLGAMLPDFASMLGVRLQGEVDGALATGIRCHHHTDEAFHGTPSFLSWTREATASLRDRGVPRQPARAAAHVGIELLLDGWLLDEPGVVPAYVAALDLPTATGALPMPADFPDRDWPWLRDRLRQTGAPEGYRSAAGVAERLLAALGRRRSLGISGEPAAVVREWTVMAHRQLDERAADLMVELRLSLEQRRALP